MYTVEQGQITRIDGTVIVKDITNPNYQQYLYWVQHGTYIGPEVALEEATPVEIPKVTLKLKPVDIEVE